MRATKLIFVMFDFAEVRISWSGSPLATETDSDLPLRRRFRENCLEVCKK